MTNGNLNNKLSNINIANKKNINYSNSKILNYEKMVLELTDKYPLYK